MATTMTIMTDQRHGMIAASQPCRDHLDAFNSMTALAAGKEFPNACAISYVGGAFRWFIILRVSDTRYDRKAVEAWAASRGIAVISQVRTLAA